MAPPMSDVKPRIKAIREREPALMGLVDPSLRAGPAAADSLSNLSRGGALPASAGLFDKIFSGKRSPSSERAPESSSSDGLRSDPTSASGFFSMPKHTTCASYRQRTGRRYWALKVWGNGRHRTVRYLFQALHGGASLGAASWNSTERLLS